MPDVFNFRRKCSNVTFSKRRTRNEKTATQSIRSNAGQSISLPGLNSNFSYERTYSSKKSAAKSNINATADNWDMDNKALTELGLWIWRYNVCYAVQIQYSTLSSGINFNEGPFFVFKFFHIFSPCFLLLFVPTRDLGLYWVIGDFRYCCDTVVVADWRTLSKVCIRLSSANCLMKTAGCELLAKFETSVLSRVLASLQCYARSQ